MRIELIVPHSYDEQFRVVVLRPLVGRFGGATVVDAQGHWENGEENVVCDDNRLIVVYTRDDTSRSRRFVTDIALEITEIWDQECVFIAFNNDHVLVYADGTIR